MISSETHLKLKCHKLSSVHNLVLSCPFLQNHLANWDKNYVERRFREFKMSLWDILNCSSPCVGLNHWRNNERDGVSNDQPYNYLLSRLFRRRSKQTSKLCVTGLCEGTSPAAGEFPAQRASNAENISIWWRHSDVPGLTQSLLSCTHLKMYGINGKFEMREGSVPIGVAYMFDFQLSPIVHVGSLA